ncbi:hypothetical protein [Sporomusa malonica]|uniref:hypothetical protein n=1 Tax=Sporomusa malonica TaxID=112901 RepID=UPI000A0322D2|nr:hypothetical protein [Sporomusa malonica]
MSKALNNLIKAYQEFCAEQAETGGCETCPMCRPVESDVCNEFYILQKLTELRKGERQGANDRSD